MIVSRAPVRLSMGGGGTDLASYYEKYGGFLMAAAINKYVYILLNKRFNESIRLSYSRTEIVDSIEQIEHRIFKEALRFTKIEKQVELVSVADMPAHCGLGTSSTFTVSLLNALFTYKKVYTSLEELAKSACSIEIDILKEPIGKQDQYASAIGGFNAYWFNKDGSVSVEPVAIKEEKLLELQNNILLFYLKKERSASSILGAQNKKIQDNDAGVIERLHKIKDMGLRTRKVFESGRIDEFGEILHEHWVTKKGLSVNISEPFIDEAYDTARKNGALGGKVVGAGGGGFLLIYCPREKGRLLGAMEKLGFLPMWFAFEREGAKIIFNG
ncbi:MAG: sugar kinase [Candidatus Omnitrophota bacterium]|jgi:D-glycero-alpha-D-manno-heptose-7-phosphate kinase